ncbi:MAG: hypothetical protein U0Q18_31805 [Bryobacteraceae bacterium]
MPGSKLKQVLLIAALGIGGLADAAIAGRLPEVLLHDGWQIQSSRFVQETGDLVSTHQFKTRGWYATKAPSTVLAALVEQHVYQDPYVGMNLRQLPGVQYPIGEGFSNIPMPPESPFAVPWWYRTEFEMPQQYRGRAIWLKFEGINFRANIWLNGHRIADSRHVAGAFRMYEFNVTSAAAPGQANVLAVEVFPPQPHDLQINWVDVNPTPPDKNMGIWRPVKLTASGPVAVRNAAVVSRLDLPGMDAAHLTVRASLANATGRPVHGLLKGEIEGIRFQREIDLAARQAKEFAFMPEDFAQLNLAHPRVWWPAKLGPQNLYHLTLNFETGGELSDTQAVQFGIRDVSSELTPEGSLLFKINGNKILIRGAGWWPDMLLRNTPERQEWELRYALDMNLNAIRMDGKFEDEHFLELCDRYGMMLLPGWCCCDHWERWKDWDEEDHVISAESLRDQIRVFRMHPSVISWLHGDDNPPPPDVEKVYTGILMENHWPNPYQTSATAQRTVVSGGTGFKMTGPYIWEPPSYWLADHKFGGAFGFITETSPSVAVPPVESLRQMLPGSHLWPVDEVWDYHGAGGTFSGFDVRHFSAALDGRLGQATSLEDYAMKAQLMNYEAQRAMYEAYGRNKYIATGVLHEMLNNAWPSLAWSLYDYYLRPGGSYFGVKKACEPVHVQYSYDDRSIVVVNSRYEAFENMRVSAHVYDLQMNEKFVKSAVLRVGPDSSERAFTIPEPADISTTYFVLARLEDAGGRLVTSNFYWLSTKPDVLEWDKTKWYYTPAKQLADMSELKNLPRVQVKVTSKVETGAQGEDRVRVDLANPARSLAFFLRLRVSKGTGGVEVLPVLWEDNYFSLMPGETRQVAATFRHADLHEATPVVEVEGWNVARTAQ